MNQSLFILALFAHGYKARVSTLYQVLIGKHTVSVLLYAFIYQQLAFFQGQTTLSKASYQKNITYLVKKGWFAVDANDFGQITAAGQAVLAEHQLDLSAYKHIDMLRFGKNDLELWRFLCFSVQVISQLAYQEKNYLPLENRPLFQQHLKKTIQPYAREVLVRTTYEEWHTLLAQLPVPSAEYLVAQFSGYPFIGQTQEQLRTTHTLKQRLAEKNQLHQLLHLLEALPETAILSQLARPFLQRNQNQSMQVTIQSWRQNQSLAAIAEQRKMKLTTIQEHILEYVLLTPECSVENWLEPETIAFLKQVPQDYVYWNYRELRKINPVLDYFQYRLFQIQQLRVERGEAR